PAFQSPARRSASWRSEIERSVRPITSVSAPGLSGGLPIQHHRNRCRILILGADVDQEALPVASNHILIAPVQKRRGNLRLEQLAWSAGLEAGRANGDRHGHQGAVEGEIEHFLPVASPPRLHPAMYRYL